MGCSILPVRRYIRAGRPGHQRAAQLPIESSTKRTSVSAYPISDEAITWSQENENVCVECRFQHPQDATRQEGTLQKHVVNIL